MAANPLKNCCVVLLSFLSRSTPDASKVSMQRISSFYLAARNFSSLKSTHRNGSSLAERCRKSGMTYPTRSLGSVERVSRFSQLNENEVEVEVEKTDEKLKKLTLDDIISKWPDQKPVWLGYRRNHKGQIPPNKTRLRCTTVSKKLLTQNPCPVCRVRVEKNYELDSKDVVFLSQFINPHTGEVLDTKKTGVCRQQQKKLINMIERSRDQGHMPFTIPGPRDPPKKFKPAGIPAPNIRNKTG